MKDLAKLKAICVSVINDPDLAPVKDPTGRIVKTYCNLAAIRVANVLGCEELDGLMADEMHLLMDSNASGLWGKVSGEDAAKYALLGGLAFASATSSMLGESHGHIAAVCPEPMQWSGSLNKKVPVVANVGVTDLDEKESLAFPPSKGEPDHFIWRDRPC